MPFFVLNEANDFYHLFALHIALILLEWYASNYSPTSYGC